MQVENLLARDVTKRDLPVEDLPAATPTSEALPLELAPAAAVTPDRGPPPADAESAFRRSYSEYGTAVPLDQKGGPMSC